MFFIVFLIIQVIAESVRIHEIDVHYDFYRVRYSVQDMDKRQTGDLVSVISNQIVMMDTVCLVLVKKTDQSIFGYDN